MAQISNSYEPSGLRDYINLPDPSFSWDVIDQSHDITLLSVQTQTWRGIPWVHRLAVGNASTRSDTAILYITGGAPNPADLADARALSATSGLETAMLFDMPNQPLFEREEDELIAFTFYQYLDDGDPTWPLLLPMAKSAVRAMDALTEWSEGRLQRFVLIGESKRAWTAWLAAASAGPRVIGIVPAVFDNLNMVAQLPHQLELWDRYSPSIHDYTDLGLNEQTGSNAGRELSRLVDPVSYASNLKARILLVHGANDPYWAVDATLLYFSKLPSGTTLLTVPNAGHVFTDKSTYYGTAGAFARACEQNGYWPNIESKLDEQNIIFVKLILSAESGAVCTYCRLFVAECESADFSEVEWVLESRLRPLAGREVRFALPDAMAACQASFVQADFELADGTTITLSTPTLLRQID